MTARDRELWDALIFNAFDNFGVSLPLRERHTLVMERRHATSFRICIQSADESYTGERLQPYAETRWWREQIQRFTNFRWTGTIEVAACRGEAPRGWVYVREGNVGEVSDDALAHAGSSRYADPHGSYSGDWHSGNIVWHSAERVRETPEQYFELALAHELGHVLGLWHTAPGTGFVMDKSGGVGLPVPRSDTERWLAQWAHVVGPGVQYPGFVRQTAPEPAGPGSLSDGVEDLVDEALDELNNDSNRRQATESVPALPAAGALLLAVLLGLVGWRRLGTR